jgi:hypothetical protein
VRGRRVTRHESCSLVTLRTREPSRLCHGEGSIRPAGVPDMPWLIGSRHRRSASLQAGLTLTQVRRDPSSSAGPLTAHWG